jgi:NAD(P)-dependent dehydrogenase (short-subunit alcohol dehydrogenase family)
MDQSAPSTSLRLENQVAVVTGGARGIGAGIVSRFVQEGARVVFSDILNQEGKGLEYFAVERFGSLDCMVNNAGAGGEGEPLAQTSVEGFDRSIALLLPGSSSESSTPSRTCKAVERLQTLLACLAW